MFTNFWKNVLIREHRDYKNLLNLIPCANNRKYATRKRFYKRTGVLFNDGKYEVTLDQRKLKTPKGYTLQIDSEPLALAVAAEWDAQSEKIQQNSMHLTGLCFTAIDNPKNLSKFDLVQEIISSVDIDTILFHSGEEDELYDLQTREWKPIVDQFCKRFNVNIEASRSIAGPVVDDKTKSVIRKHLLSYNMWAVYGFCYMVDTLKSVILGLSCADRHISVQKAVLLSRLEEEFQSGHWGRVEWAHGLNQEDMQARVAAAVLFIHFNSSSYFVKQKAEVT